MLMSKAIQNIDHILIDLKLDASLKPRSVSEFQKSATKVFSNEQLASSLVRGKTYAIGSGSKGDQIYYYGDLGLLGCIFAAWRNHWILRTRPEDWWGPIACKIAKAVDKAAKRGGAYAEQVRDLFVSHQGQQAISVSLPSATIYDSNYDVFFSSICSQIEEKIKVPKYAQAMQNDFGSSGPAHKIASQINLMASMQEFFTFKIDCCICGLKGLEMLGSVEDWDRLVTKLQQVREALEPIKNQISLGDSWWSRVLDVFQNLANTRHNPDDSTVAKFWSNILRGTTETVYFAGDCISMPEPSHEIPAYDGWLISFLTDRERIRAEDLYYPGKESVKKQLSGWNQVPLTVSLTLCSPPIQDESTLVAGIVGYKLHTGDEEICAEQEAIRWHDILKGFVDGYLGKRKRSMEKKNDGQEQSGELVPSIEPNHMWAMLLPPRSKLRG